MRVLGLALLVGALSRSPIIIIPGDGSNRLEARLDKPAGVAWYCALKAGWFPLWLNLGGLIAGTTCWADNIRLAVDEDGFARNAPGVATRVPGFGDTSSLESLDPRLPAQTKAFAAMVAELVKAGYEKNKTLRGAPYDFRYGPDADISKRGDETPAFQGKMYFDAVRLLVEETVLNSGERATLLSHSMGGLQCYYFLSQMTAEWKLRYIRQWTPISAPLAGEASDERVGSSEHGTVHP
ncbi:Lecithin:cholesterol acyltransferase-domain-containing protein [Pelagophyceae sp. CCMP2097]|nr:Lecithin:cholesterol acyltransferase-domain-containing protein [Pelagophyceae sp. CCMP2097]|mmetsp:Transcript_7902/g.25819  ORF Transcript_7902/g.25819 Transcript_7902/m.25819 type:complete len:238 (-) Transcript_7902:704-1417(-)